MKIKKANRLAALTLVAAFSATNSREAEATLTCTPVNTADFAVLQYDIELLPSGSFPARMEVTIKNQGPGVNQDFIYYEIYEVDSNNVRLGPAIKMVNTSSTIPANGQVVRTIAFTAAQIHQGQKYEVNVKYACDPNLANNFMYQVAYNVGGLPDAIFSGGFEDGTPSVVQTIVKSLQENIANDEEIVIKDRKFGNGEFEILVYPKLKQPKLKP